MASYISSNPVTRAVAAELSGRNFGRADIEQEAECETCEFEGEMEFTVEGSEEAAAECPACGDRVEIYIGA